jgi:sulfopyruvate decarboxylase TPP-binding subunit
MMPAVAVAGSKPQKLDFMSGPRPMQFMPTTDLGIMLTLLVATIMSLYRVPIMIIMAYLFLTNQEAVQD